MSAREYSHPVGRTVGAGPPWPPLVGTRIHGVDSLEFGEHDLNQGRPRGAAPTGRSEKLFDSYRH